MKTSTPSTHFRRTIAMLFLGSCVAAFCSSTQMLAQENGQSEPLLQAVRDYGKGHQRIVSTVATSSAYSHVTEELYFNQVAASLRQREFSKLENEAQRARTAKDRFPGGPWALFFFYDALSKPALDGQAQDADWLTRLALLKEWTAAHPDSATARVAIAQSYIYYAWAARGEGWSDSVGDSGWKLFNERMATAAAILIDAAVIKEGCPHWYRTVQQIALAQGWTKAQARELFNQATSFEPDYYQFYREYANFLLPKWQGEEGDTEAFAEEASNRGRGKQGLFLYFEISTQLMCQCGLEHTPMAKVSWPKVKQGYAALGQLYGFSSLKSNRMAFMSFVAGDKQAAQAAFVQIGDHWEKAVWITYERFENAKTWATSP